MSDDLTATLDELPAYLLAGVHRFLESSCIFALTDVRGKIVFANDAFCAISGYSRPELIGQNHRILKSGQHTAEFYHELWRTIARGETWHGEICNRAKDGRLYWVDSTISAIRDPGGRISHYCALRVDITARKEAQTQLISWMQREAEAQKMESVGRLADAVCHDVNNLLGIALLMADTFETPGEQRDLQKSILLRMAQLIRNVRDFSTGRPTEMRVFNAGRMIADTCKLVSFEAVRTGRIRLHVNVEPLEQYELRANESQILEVLLNLLTNAVEAMQGQADATLRVRGQADASGEQAQVFVEDNGPGIPDELRDSVFDAFVSGKGRGRGIGLAASRRIARDHGGDLEILPAERGALFLLTLPIFRPVAREDSRPGTDQVVLIADDDPEVIAYLARVLESQGFRPISSATADEVLLRAEQFKDHLAAAVLDAVGNTDEFALVGYLRSVRPDLTMILTSGTLPTTGPQETKHGPVHFLPKPFQPQELIRLLRQRQRPA